MICFLRAAPATFLSSSSLCKRRNSPFSVAVLSQCYVIPSLCSILRKRLQLSILHRNFHCSGTCLLLKTAQDSQILQKILDRLVLEILFTSWYCIVKLKTKFTELKKTNSQKQTYQKGELKSGLKGELTLLAAS